MNENQRQTLSWALFFTLMAFVSYYFVLKAVNVSNDFSEYTALSDRLRGEPLNKSFQRELTEPFYLLMFWFMSNSFSSKLLLYL